MRGTKSRIVGLSIAGALALSLVPLPAMPADATSGGAVTTSPAPTATPTATAEPAATATPTPTPTPTPTATAGDLPKPLPTSSPLPGDEDHEHLETDGPTMPLTRELPTRTVDPGVPTVPTTRLSSSYGPQPVFHFPWAPGKRWGASGPHADSDGIHEGAIDFAPLGSSTTVVRAVAAGQVYRVSCAGGWFLGIDHGGGWMSEYYHLRSANSALVGKWVEAGAALGLAGQTLPCGGTPGSSPHVHLSILNEVVDVPSGKRQYIPVSGIQFDRYELYDSSGAYNGVWRDMSGARVLTSERVTCCLTASTRIGPSSPKAVLPDANGNGIDDRAEVNPWDTDLNSDGRADIVAFDTTGVMVSRSTGSVFTTATRALSSFGTETGWSTSTSLRTVMDVTGDGAPDIVGFGGSGVFVARGNGSGGFGSPSRWTTAFSAGSGWSLSGHVRTLADVNGDGLRDIIGFGKYGVSVSLNTGGAFGAPRRWSNAMGGEAAGSWDTTRHQRFVRDVNGDGRADLIGFGASGVQVALSTGDGFAAPRSWSAAFGLDRGWRVDVTPRQLTDMNADGRPDVVGFGRDGVYVALNTGSSFATARRWTTSFGLSSGSRGWQTTRDPRVLADVNGDGRPDIVGLRTGGAWVARNTGSAFTSAARWTTDYGSTEWTLGVMPRGVADVNGDDRADIVGFARHGVHVALSTGSRFGAASHWNAQYGWGKSTGHWLVRTKPRGINAG
ncbi:exported hypothetical protein [uncultured Microbacterium sp.]|uniref:M23ase beta-sheet core domain-containing protein n=1 Tax=uncultured Microbacterium sp. TaxID=191216 RepID=A0A1Y5P1V9_9MICO|nr:exported hypothetical protein [uncultured Microbacterium sp.]